MKALRYRVYVKALGVKRELVLAAQDVTVAVSAAAAYRESVPATLRHLVEVSVVDNDTGATL
ncbi:hypothetical protein SEA_CALLINALLBARBZ_28 [Arthrobacter phage CallinAllBarbz]|uniref:Uncharacterized protein n=1 Tax=Arthrobacter phage CallinAllBarbz TaxID=3077790 RepID=A0AA96HD24_9CAUD|nr:hypothetical protein SEA_CALLINALLBARBZ_28 [Arthrobacter phage CallinAllBarbz]